VQPVVVLFLLLGVCDVACSRVVKPRAQGEGEAMANTAAYRIDDFSKAGGVSALGTRWETITDQVMGGISTGSHTFGEVAGERALRLQGDVSLENNGGFVQARLMLDSRERLLDASGFKGIRLRVRGNGETYSVHLRTSRTWLPWQFFHATFVAGEEWREVELPFTRFRSESFALGARLNPGRLKSLAIVAIKKAFHADVAVSRIEFYP